MKTVKTDDSKKNASLANLPWHSDLPKINFQCEISKEKKRDLQQMLIYLGNEYCWFHENLLTVPRNAGNKQLMLISQVENMNNYSWLGTVFPFDFQNLVYSLKLLSYYSVYFLIGLLTEHILVVLVNIVSPGTDVPAVKTNFRYFLLC